MRESTWSEFRKTCGAPQRICWAVAEHEGARSICPLGWHMTTSFAPPMMAISIAPSRYTHDLVKNSGEVVLAWPGADLAEATMTTGTRSGRDMDKFADCGLTPSPAGTVGAPLVAECQANLECRVTDAVTTGDHTLFAVEILRLWLADETGPVLCQIGREEGYDFLMEKGMYRFGVVKR